MPVIKKYVEPTFKVKVNEKETALVILDEYMCVWINGDDRENHPIRIHESHGMLVWIDDRWGLINSKVNEAYMDYIAEKELLGNGDG